MLARGIGIDHLDRIRIGHDSRQVDGFLLQRLAERGTHDGLGRETEIDQQFTERLVNLFLLGQRDVQLIFGDDPFIDQNLTQPLRLVFRVHNFPRICNR